MTSPDYLTYFISHPGYWGGLIVVILCSAGMKTISGHWREREGTIRPPVWQIILHGSLLITFIVAGLTVLYYKVFYLTYIWNDLHDIWN
jgi:hypothetical protein